MVRNASSTAQKLPVRGAPRRSSAAKCRNATSSNPVAESPLFLIAKNECVYPSTMQSVYRLPTIRSSRGYHTPGGFHGISKLYAPPLVDFSTSSVTLLSTTERLLVNVSFLSFLLFLSANLKGVPSRSCSAAMSSNVFPWARASFLILYVRASHIQ